MLSLTGALVASVLVLTTQNVRVTLPPEKARHDIHQAAHGSSVVVTQEMGRRHAASFAPSGWGSAHFRGLFRGDCATYWQRDSWHLAQPPRLRQLTYAPFKHGHRFALVTVLRGHQTAVAVVCLHMITHWLDRRAVYARGMERLRTLVAHLRASWPHVVVAGDWNRPWPARARLARFHSRRPGAATGPGGGGRIDYADWHHLHWRHSRVLGHTYSDHQGFRVRLAIP